MTHFPASYVAENPILKIKLQEKVWYDFDVLSSPLFSACVTFALVHVWPDLNVQFQRHFSLSVFPTVVMCTRLLFSSLFRIQFHFSMPLFSISSSMEQTDTLLWLLIFITICLPIFLSYSLLSFCVRYVSWRLLKWYRWMRLDRRRIYSCTWSSTPTRGKRWEQNSCCDNMQDELWHLISPHPTSSHIFCHIQEMRSPSLTAYILWNSTRFWKRTKQEQRKPTKEKDEDWREECLYVDYSVIGDGREWTCLLLLFKFVFPFQLLDWLLEFAFCKISSESVGHFVALTSRLSSSRLRYPIVSSHVLSYLMSMQRVSPI